jgi:hypothetical protein
MATLLISLTAFRRRELEKTYFLDCNCPRCEDGTEMGTNYGGIIDNQYPNYIFVPQDPRLDRNIIDNQYPNHIFVPQDPRLDRNIRRAHWT